MIDYVIRFHVGTASKSTVVQSIEIKAENDIEADKLRQQIERKVEFPYDFNLVSQKIYLENQNLFEKK
jgi:hypothetical protein